MEPLEWINAFFSSRCWPVHQLGEREDRLREAAGPGATAPLRLLLDACAAEVNDEMLMWALQNEFFEREAYEVLYRRYCPVVASAFPRWGVPEQDAGDLAQGLFFDLWRTRFPTYDPDGRPFRPYLLGTAHNRAMQWHRNNRGPCPCGSPECADRAGDPVDEAILNDLLAEFEQAQAALPGCLHDVFRRSLGRQSRGEIAEQIGVTPEAVSARLNQAWVRVRNRVGLGGVRMPRTRPDPQEPPEGPHE
jgi:RNA polymerase sigma factor (sigma-70 family)